MTRSLVYYADDDHDDLEMFKDACEDLGYEVKLFDSALKLLDALEDLPIPGVIFLDINMPQMDGLATLAKFKAHEKYSTIPVVIYTTSSNPVDIEKAWELGASRFITKCRTFQKIIDALRKTLAIDWQQENAGKEMFFIR